MPSVRIMLALDRGHQDGMPELYNPLSYTGSQPFGDFVRLSGGDGMVYDSLPLVGGVNIAALRPTNVLDITQTEHFEISVTTADRLLRAHKLAN